MRTLALIIAIVALAGCNEKTSTEVTIRNHSTDSIRNVALTIQRSSLTAFPGFADHLLPVLKDEKGNVVPSQADDLDRDGIWDELFFMTDLLPNQTRNVHVAWVDPGEAPVLKPRTNIRFAAKNENYREVITATRETHAINTRTQQVWQMEGPAWENERVGFRNYFDRRNGMDIFGKVTHELVLDQVGYKNNPSYHTFNPEWGVDVLKVGNSLGAGSLAFLYRDTLYRVGDNGSGDCTVITEGPLRSILRFRFKDWNLGDQVLQVIHDVMIFAGTRYYQSEISWEGNEEKIYPVTGIVNMKSDQLYRVEEQKEALAFYTHDKQSEDGTILGMGVMLEEKCFREVFTAPGSGEGITQTYGIIMDPAEGSHVRFRFYSGWEREDPKWADKKAFDEYLASETSSFRANVSIEIH